MVKLSKKKIAGIVSVSIVGALILAIGICVLYAFCYDPYKPTNDEEMTYDAFYSTWQDSIIDSATIDEIVTVGSHDAATVGMSPNAMTQGSGLLKQLQAGSRYFDLRVKKKGNDLVIFHGPMTGQKFSSVLSDINQFISANSTQFLILDFQHLGDKDHMAVKEMIVDKLDISHAMVKSVCSTAAGTTIGTIRTNGFNYIILWCDSDEAAEEDFLYFRDTNLSSPYDSDLFASKNPKDVIEMLPTYIDGNDSTKIFVLQAQKTAPNFIFDRLVWIEDDYRDNYINPYLKSLKGTESVGKLNIIMRDYVNRDMDNVRIILAFNLEKGLVKPDCIAKFNEMTTY